MYEMPMQPIPGRPTIPDYGIPEDENGLLPWDYVIERLENAVNYWVCTANQECQPHATPVWGVWNGDRLFFDGSPKTRRGRDLANNPKVSIHLEDGKEAVMLEGEAHEHKQAPYELRAALAAAYSRKYAQHGYEPTPEIWEKGGLYRFTPHIAYAWCDFPRDTTRWVFKSENTE